MGGWWGGGARVGWRVRLYGVVGCVTHRRSVFIIVFEPVVVGWIVVCCQEVLGEGREGMTFLQACALAAVVWLGFIARGGCWGSRVGWVGWVRHL